MYITTQYVNKFLYIDYNNTHIYTTHLYIYINIYSITILLLSWIKLYIFYLNILYLQYL